MGQPVSRAEGQARAGGAGSLMFTDNLQRHAYEYKQLLWLSHHALLENIQELNTLAATFRDINGKTLVFQIKRGSDRTFLWRGTIRIKCHKVNANSGAIESSRQMNLKQFVHLYNDIKQKAIITDLKKLSDDNDFSASIILEGLGAEVLGVGVNEGEECCICMDRYSEVILACSHSYCEKCIDQWQGRNHKTCPICRAKVNTRTESWVLTERPDVNEIAFETTESIMRLSDQTGIAAHEKARNVSSLNPIKTMHKSTNNDPEAGTSGLESRVSGLQDGAHEQYPSSESTEEEPIFEAEFASPAENSPDNSPDISNSSNNNNDSSQMNAFSDAIIDENTRHLSYATNEDTRSGVQDQIEQSVDRPSGTQTSEPSIYHSMPVQDTSGPRQSVQRSSSWDEIVPEIELQ